MVHFFMTLVMIREFKRDGDCVITYDCPKGREWSINNITEKPASTDNASLQRLAKAI